MIKTKNHEKIITALLGFSSITKAAKSLELSKSTLYNYLKSEDFKDKYDKEHTKIVNSSNKTV